MHSCGTDVWETKFNVTSDWCHNEMVIVLDIILLENAGSRCVLSPLDVHCMCINVSPAVIPNNRPYQDTCAVSVYGGHSSSHVFKQKDIKDNRLSIMISPTFIPRPTTLHWINSCRSHWFCNSIWQLCLEKDKIHIWRRLLATSEFSGSALSFQCLSEWRQWLLK